jgi:RNA-directed DNA polymerase
MGHLCDGSFDNIDHDLLMKAVQTHTDCKWMLLYIERWLKAPLQSEDGELHERKKGTPQGGVISPLLANLFLHYAFDKWMTREFPKLPFCRYADDGLVHCRSLAQANMVRSMLAERFKACGLEMHPDKTKIVYCKGVHRAGDYENIQFDFLGYTFRPRKTKDRYGRIFLNFTPAMSRLAGKAIRQTIRSWKIQLKSEKTIEDIARMFGPMIRGWINYYGLFHPSALKMTADLLNRYLARWAMRKFKRYRGHKRRALQWIGKIAQRQPNLFAHWQAGFVPSAG